MAVETAPPVAIPAQRLPLDWLARPEPPPAADAADEDAPIILAPDPATLPRIFPGL